MYIKWINIYLFIKIEAANSANLMYTSAYVLIKQPTFANYSLMILSQLKHFLYSSTHCLKNNA